MCGTSVAAPITFERGGSATKALAHSLPQPGSARVLGPGPVPVQAHESQPPMNISHRGMSDEAGVELRDDTRS